MRKSGWGLALLAAAAWAQQSGPATKANQTKTAPIAHAKSSTRGDLAVPTCPAKFNDSLETDGIAAKDAPGVIPAMEKNSIMAEISDEAEQANEKTHVGEFDVDLSLVVDTNGDPGNICLMKSAGYGLDASAATAVRQYKFDPATKDGKPVRERIFTEVSFMPY
jgi:protein TonB